MSTYIKNTKQFEEEIRCCRELKIERHKCGISYTHHVFVGKVDGEGCDLYHYAQAIKPFFKAKFPGKIKKVRLTFKEHDTCQETLDIFDFDKDDVWIAERDDYPKDQKAEEKCIRKAESRLGEEMYSAINNNCESFVNWIFSNDNTSLQSENCDVIKKSVGNAIDGIGSSGILRPVGYLTNGIFQQSKKSKQETSKTNLQNSDFETENSFSVKTNETKVKRLAKEYETKMEQRHSRIFVKNVEKAYSQDLERKNKKSKIQTPKDKTHKTNYEHFDKEIDNAKPMNYDATEKVPTLRMRKYTKDSNSHDPGREARGLQQQQQDKFNGEEEDTRCTNVKDNAKEKTKKRNIFLSQRLERLEKERKYAKEEQLRENSENAQHQESSKYRDTEQAQQLENAKVHKAENARARELKDKIEAKTVQSEKLKDQSYISPQQQTSNKTETKSSEKFQKKNEYVKEQTSGSQSYEANHINLWTDESVLTVGRGLVGASSMCSNKVINAIEKSDALKTILEQQFKKSAKKKISKCVCQKAKDEGMKKVSQTVSNVGMGFSFAVETASLTMNIYYIAKNKHMTSVQKNRSISREVVTSASGLAGTIIGQALIPFPVVGSFFGGVVGNAIGGMLGGGIFS